MKRVLSLGLVLCLIVVSLTGCNSKITYNKNYDTSKYEAIKDISGVVFLEPLKYYNKIESYDAIKSTVSKLNDQEKIDYFKNHVESISYNNSDYQLMKLSDFYIYVMTLSGVSNITNYANVEQLPKVCGVDKFIKLESSNPSLKESVDEKNGTRIIFGSEITYTDQLGSSQYSGYTVLIQNKKESTVYAMIVGFTNSSNKSTAKEIAENFYLA